MEQIKISLFNCHKQTPVRKYILNHETDFSDIQAVEKVIEAFIIDYVWVQVGYKKCINQADDTFVSSYSGAHELTVFVRDCPLSAVVSLVKICATNGVSLTLMHYNAVNKNWDAQKVF